MGYGPGRPVQCAADRTGHGLQQAFRPTVVRAYAIYAAGPRHDRRANDASPGSKVWRQAARHPEADHAARAIPERSRQRTRQIPVIAAGDHSNPRPCGDSSLKCQPHRGDQFAPRAPCLRLEPRQWVAHPCFSISTTCAQATKDLEASNPHSAQEPRPRTDQKVRWLLTDIPAELAMWVAASGQVEQQGPPEGEAGLP
jgi:hypothetical protein